MADPVKTSECIETSRLRLRRPISEDAEAIYARYASDPEVVRFMGWPLHRSLDDTRAFLKFSEAEWQRWSAGTYLIESRDDGRLLGSTGLSFETPTRASTGYVLARDAWGHGYATEALKGIIEVASKLGVRRLYALCYTEHAASSRVLEECGFSHEGTLRRHSELPNLHPGEPCDMFCYARIFE